MITISNHKKQSWKECLVCGTDQPIDEEGNLKEYCETCAENMKLGVV